MRLISNKSPIFVWLLVLVVVVGITSFSYFILQSNTDSNDYVISESATSGSAVSQEASVKQLAENSAVKKEDIAEGTVITSGDSEFGSMLFDDKGQAIYIWELEESTTAECYGNCAEAWPPVLTDGVPIASGSVKDELLGTTERTDGTTQVTYNGHPLYYYAHEEVGEVKCHNVSTHGGLWWVIQPNGVRAE